MIGLENIKATINSPLSEMVPIKLTNIGNYPTQQIISPMLSPVLSPVKQVISPFQNFSTPQLITPQLISPQLGFPSRIKFASQFVPSISTSIKPYDPIENMYITSNYSCGDTNVTISGRKKDVEKTIRTLRSCSIENTIRRPLFEESEAIAKNSLKNNDEIKFPSTKKFYSIDEVLSGNVNKEETIVEKNTKWYLSEDPMNPSKVFAIKYGSEEKYSGTGAIIIENNYINPNTKMNSPTIILVKTRRGTVEDMGGEIDKKIALSDDLLEQNTIKEIYEESQRMFTIENANLNSNYFNLRDSSRDTYYKCYFVFITGTENENLTSLFKINREINVNLLRGGIDYEETEDILRFYMSDIQNSIKTSVGGNLQCKDVNGQSWIIRDRTANCLRLSFGNNLMEKVKTSIPIVVQKTEKNIETPIKKHALTNFII